MSRKAKTPVAAGGSGEGGSVRTRLFHRLRYRLLLALVKRQGTQETVGVRIGGLWLYRGADAWHLYLDSGRHFIFSGVRR